MKNITFENAVERLEEIVHLLESGDCPLDKTVELYDEGLKLAELCKKLLDNARGRVISLKQFEEECFDNE